MNETNGIPEVQEDVDVFGALEGYEPEVIKDGFDVLKGKFGCSVETARVEDYEGEPEELLAVKDLKTFKVDFVINDGQDNAGRHLFKTFYLRTDDGGEKEGSRGKYYKKTGMEKLADSLWTVGLKFNSMATLEDCAEKLCDLTVLVKGSAAYRHPDGSFGKKTEDSDEIQVVRILGVHDASQAPSNGGSATPAF